MAKVNREDLTSVGELVASGKLKPVIDRRYALVEVPEAMRYQGTWRARGKLVIGLDA
jgi:NADPH:quinone reductase-like Zn-dependent oxidoreductase